MEHLEPFSKEVAEEIFATYPQWRAFTSANRTEGAEPILRICVPSPVSNVEHQLTIDTSDGEITISYDYHHGHYVAFQDSGHREGAAIFLSELLEEHIAVASFWHGEQWRGSAHFRVGETADPLDIRSSATRVRIRSWRGTYDKDGPV